MSLFVTAAERTLTIVPTRRERDSRATVYAFAADVYCFSWAAAETRGKDRANFPPPYGSNGFCNAVNESLSPPSSCSSTIVSCRGNELISPVAEHLSLLPVFLTLLLNWRSGFSTRAPVLGFTGFALRFVDVGDVLADFGLHGLRSEFTRGFWR